MVRLIEETIEVRVGDPQRTGGDGLPGAPEQFLWRGRLYRVTEVVAHWQERHPWWRAAAEQPLARVPLARQVWRVEASRGRSSVPGVYDLGVDTIPVDSAPVEGTGDTDGAVGAEGGAGGGRLGCPPSSSWLLLRTQD